MQKIYSGKLTIFTLDGRNITVDKVIDHWHEDGGEHITLLSEDERIYLLRRGEDNRWEVKRVYLY